MGALSLVTGYAGEDHVTAEQVADFQRGILGDAVILPVGNKMAVNIQTANQIVVQDGVALYDGREVYIDYGESVNVAIESGTQNMLRNDIVVVKYTKDEESGVENAVFEVITGVPAAANPQDPSYENLDIRTGVFMSQKPFCRVRLNGTAIEGIDMLVGVSKNIENIAESLSPLFKLIQETKIVTVNPNVTTVVESTLSSKIPSGYTPIATWIQGGSTLVMASQCMTNGYNYIVYNYHNKQLTVKCTQTLICVRSEMVEVISA